jgi:hypothetical protein
MNEKNLMHWFNSGKKEEATNRLYEDANRRERKMRSIVRESQDGD